MNHKPKRQSPARRRMERKAKESACGYLKIAKMIQAGLMIQRLTCSLSQFGSEVLEQWEKEGDQYCFLLAMAEYDEGPHNALVDVQAFHPIAFQYGRRFYFN